jgi:hypothetical protein
MMPILPAMVIASTILVANQVPKLNVMPSCRAAAEGALGMKQDISACIESENAARDELVKQWSSFPAKDRASCTSLTSLGGMEGTYTELITCLEMKRDAAKLPKYGESTGLRAR